MKTKLIVGTVVRQKTHPHLLGIYVLISTTTSYLLFEDGQQYYEEAILDNTEVIGIANEEKIREFKRHILTKSVLETIYLEGFFNSVFKDKDIVQSFDIKEIKDIILK